MISDCVGLSMVDGVSKIQFPRWKRWSPEVAICDFEIKVISKWILKSWVEFSKSFRNGPLTLPSCLEMIITSSF